MKHNGVRVEALKMCRLDDGTIWVHILDGIPCPACGEE